MGCPDPRKYYVEQCYALKNCLHCPDCLAFALKYLRESVPKDADEKLAKKKQNIALKFIISTIASGSLPCSGALPAEDLKSYLNGLLKGEEKLPVTHYEFSK